jgi:hypothetical protein
MNSSPLIDRRGLIRSLAGGSLLMPGILTELLAESSADPLAARPPHHRPRARRVIFIFLSGGFSQLDTFDFKPKLVEWHERKVPVPGSEGNALRVLRPFWEFRPRGRCGMLISDLFPNIASCADELCVIRSLRTDHRDHTQATLGIHTGSVMFTRPSIGSWVSYGLGTLNRNLPSFMVFAPYLPLGGGEQVWGSDFLPAIHQGTRVVTGPRPIPNLERSLPEVAQEVELGLLESYNRRHLKGRGDDPTLAGRMRSFETAFGMQREAPEALDVSGETDATLALYGVERGRPEGFGWQCLVARRLAERGVRFIELIERGATMYDNWDSHENMQDHVRRARSADRPVAALLKDLRSRGMLDETLVVFTTEFGRPPFEDGSKGIGRSHQPAAFTSWLAGGGVRGGMTYGATDELGLTAVENPVHVNDFHATILYLMGLDHLRLTYRHSGRDFRLTDVGGRVIQEILA